MKTLLLSTDIAHSLADALDVPLTGEPTEVAPSLWAVQIDTQRAVRGRLARRAELPRRPALARRRRPDHRRRADRPARCRRGAGAARRARAGAGRGLGRAGRRLRADGRDVAAARPARGADLVPAEGVPGPSPHREGHAVRSPRCSAAARSSRPTTSSRRCCGSTTSSPAVRRLLGDPEVTSVRLVLTPESVVAGRGAADVHRSRAVRLRGRPDRREPGLPGRRRRLAAGLGARRSRSSSPRSASRSPGCRCASWPTPTEPVGATALREVAETLYGELPGRTRRRSVPPHGAAARRARRHRVRAADGAAARREAAVDAVAGRRRPGRDGRRPTGAC